MKIVVVGAGSVGRFVAQELIAHGHTVTLIDNNPSHLQVASVADADWVLADACSPETLAEAGLGDSDVLVAATGDDKANLVVSMLAKTEFGVPRVVSRLKNPRNEWLFDASWGVDVVVSTPRLMTALVEEAITVGQAVKLFSFNTAEASMYAFVVPEGSPTANRRIGDIPLPPQTMLTAILRDGRPLPAQQDDIYRVGDELLFLVPDKHAQSMEQISATFDVPTPVEDAPESAAD